MAIRCGSCKGRHGTVAEVKGCYGQPIRDHLQERREQTVMEKRQGVDDGYYTAVFADGDHRTIRLRTQPKDARFAPGEQIASYLSGPDNESDYQGFAFVKPDGRFNVWKRYRDSHELIHALEIVTGDSETSGQEYALRSNRCRRCNRTLTVPASINRGFGPHCAGVA